MTSKKTQLKIMISLTMCSLMLSIMFLKFASATECTNSSVQFEIICHGFESWTEANKAMQGCNLYHPSTIGLRPNMPLLFTSELNLSFPYSLSELHLFGVNGLNVFPWPAPQPSLYRLSIYVSTIEFFINNKAPSEYVCSPNLIPERLTTNSSRSVFSFMYSFRLVNGNTFKADKTPVCPYVFKSNQVTEFYIYDQVDSFLFVNLLQFEKSNLLKDNITSIDSQIKDLNIVKSYNYKVDESLLHPLVFEKLMNI
jgi:hypothetical protein